LYITTTGGIPPVSDIVPTGKLLKLDIGLTSGLYDQTRRVLIVLSNHHRGVWLEEFGATYNKLKEHEYDVVLSSPNGGVISIDEKSYPQNDEQQRQYQKAIQELNQPTHHLEHQSAVDYDAIFVPGGHAPMYDLVDNTKLKELIIEFDTQMKPIASICHGVVGLLNVRRQDGIFLINGRTLTAFSIDEESDIQSTPFLLETRLKDQGAYYVKMPPKCEHVLQDGLILTGQNPSSSTALANLLIKTIEQCSKQDYSQINLTSSQQKLMITWHISNASNIQLLQQLKLAHLEYIQRNQHFIVFSGSTLRSENPVVANESNTMNIVTTFQDFRQAQYFIDNEPYTASRQIFDTVTVRPFKQLIPSSINALQYHIQNEIFNFVRTH
ncbi:unnamed protein product, partial [Didymodactylos carnosus]